ncbi:MAG: rhamnulokinase family protein [Chloroflexota bacterium]
MRERNFLAIDLGAESGRAIAGNISKGKLALTEMHRFQNKPINTSSGLQWDMGQLWQEIKKGVFASNSKFRLESLALDAWGVDFALLDDDGRLLNNPYHYRDKRTDGMLEKAFRLAPRKQIFAQTGIQFMQINTLYQLFAMVIAHDPQLETAQTFLTIPDLLNYWLSGRITCEFTNATTTQCFDPRERSWATSLLEIFWIPTRIFPSVCEPGTSLGNLLPEVASETGAGSIPVIAPACHDTGSAVVAVPAANQDFAWLSSGTWSILGAEVREPILSPKALEYNFTNEGGVFGTWQLSKNITGLWIVQECKREWGLSYDELTRLAAEAKPFMAVIDPDAPVFLHSGNMPEKVRGFCADTKQTVPQTQGEIVRIVLESLALKYRFVLERLEELTGKRLDPLHIFGGGTNNKLLNQFSADATGRTVIAGPVEATAIGNILMQAITLGEIGSLTEARLLVRRSFEIEEYHSRKSDDWDRTYARLRSLLSS